ncbi:MAG: trypsin-like peptidase domain-containing protein [Hyphomicrobiales bacterium]
MMRLSGAAVALSIVLGTVPATAQESPGIQPAPAQVDAKPKPAHPARKTAARPAPPKISAPATISAKTAAVTSAPARLESPIDAGISGSERLKIRSALLWSGDYTGSTGGEDPLLSAIKNYQKRAKAKVTGVLSPAERTNLLAAAQTHEDEFGWTVVVDPATGVRIGLPTKLVPQARDTPHGTRWSASHGEVQVETFRIKNPDLKLAAFFEQQKKEPSTRKVEQSALRDDGFVISGMQGLKKFSVRAYSRDGEIRGVTVLFDQMMETIVAPVTAAMVSAFSPFPERSLPFAATARSVEYGTGLIVSSRGHIVTDRKLAAGCQVIIAAGLGDADRVAEDHDNGLALLRVYGPRKLSPLALAPDTARKGDITLVGIPDPKEQNGAKKLTEIKARLAQGNAIELRQPVPMAGFSGAAAVDAQGQFLGMMEMRNFVLASIEPSAPPVRLITTETIRTFLTAHNVPLASHGGDAKTAVVRIICVRK